MVQVQVCTRVIQRAAHSRWDGNRESKKRSGVHTHPLAVSSSEAYAGVSVVPPHRTCQNVASRLDCKTNVLTRARETSSGRTVRLAKPRGLVDI